ncbi:MAG TPA: M15 family metallopeptidase [bacterium]|nr:M15 family metallopeptidase [bacterium]
MNQLEKIKNTPIKTPKWIVDLKYFDDRFKVNNKIKKRKLNKKHGLFAEKIVDYRKYGLKGESYYWQFRQEKQFKKIKNLLPKEFYLRKSIVEDLQKVNNFLKKYNLSLYVKSGYRNEEVQLAAIDYFSAKGDEKQKMLFAQPKERSANHPYPHSTGATFDLTLYDLKRKQFINLRFRKDITVFGIERVKKITTTEKKIRAYRRLLYNILCTPVILEKENLFTAHPFEYWHFSRGDQLARFWSGSDKMAYYGEAK